MCVCDSIEYSRSNNNNAISIGLSITFHIFFAWEFLFHIYLFFHSNISLRHVDSSAKQRSARKCNENYSHVAASVLSTCHCLSRTSAAVSLQNGNFNHFVVYLLCTTYSTVQAELSSVVHMRMSLSKMVRKKVLVYLPAY